MGKKVVLDGVGAVFTRNMSGNLKFTSSRINKVTLSMNGPYDKLYAGDSAYPFHLTPKDRDDKITLESPQFSTELFELGQGATTASGSATLDEFEQFVIPAGASYTLAKGATLVASSDELYDAATMTKFTRVASAPTAGQYAIGASGVITFNAADAGKKMIAVYKWTTTTSSSAYILPATRTVPFKLVHRANLQDDDTGASVPVQLTVYKCQALGAFTIDQSRKQASAISVELAVLDPGITTDNPSGKTIEFIRVE